MSHIHLWCHCGQRVMVAWGLTSLYIYGRVWWVIREGRTYLNEGHNLHCMSQLRIHIMTKLDKLYIYIYIYSCPCKNLRQEMLAMNEARLSVFLISCLHNTFEQDWVEFIMNVCIFISTLYIRKHTPKNWEALTGE